MPRLIDAEADRNHCEEVSEKASKAVQDLCNRRLHKLLQLEAKLRKDSSKGRHNSKQISRQAKQRVSRLVMLLSKIVLVEKNACLSHGYEDQSRRL